MDSLAHIEAARWETLWAPYDETTYQDVLRRVSEQDIVLDIGAGDFRLADRLAKIAGLVYGIEIIEEIIPVGHLSEGVIALHGDARQMEFPQGITVGVLLMRHCQNFRLYAEKLNAAGADRLITNARWRMGVETLFLKRERIKYDDFEMGWYACWCGRVGFKPGAPEKITPEVMETTYEVFDCPGCSYNGDN